MTTGSEGRTNIFGMTAGGLKTVCRQLGLPPYADRQLAEWLYNKKVSSFDCMTNLSLDSRRALGRDYYIGLTPPAGKQLSRDGTIKYLFPAADQHYIESVFIPETDRNTLCLSTQVGCKMGCVFCMTGRQGFQADLSAGDMLNQFVSLPERETVSNFVFMGMGEPLDNADNLLECLEIMTSSYGFGISPRRITVSTTGVIPAMGRFLSETRCHLAVCLNSPFSGERMSLMPVEKVYPVRDVVGFLKKAPVERQRRISFEYIMFRGFNDTPGHVNGLTRLLNGLRCRINLIRYHPVADLGFQPSDDETIQWFRKRLNDKGIVTTLRASRGTDIMAACGMLSTRFRYFPGANTFE